MLCTSCGGGLQLPDGSCVLAPFCKSRPFGHAAHGMGRLDCREPCVLYSSSCRGVPWKQVTAICKRPLVRLLPPAPLRACPAMMETRHVPVPTAPAIGCLARGSGCRHVCVLRALPLPLARGHGPASQPAGLGRGSRFSLRLSCRPVRPPVWPGLAGTSTSPWCSSGRSGRRSRTWTSRSARPAATTAWPPSPPPTASSGRAYEYSHLRPRPSPYGRCPLPCRAVCRLGAVRVAAAPPPDWREAPERRVLRPVRREPLHSAAPAPRPPHAVQWQLHRHCGPVRRGAHLPGGPQRVRRGALRAAGGGPLWSVFCVLFGQGPAGSCSVPTGTQRHAPVCVPIEMGRAGTAVPKNGSCVCFWP